MSPLSELVWSPDEGLSIKIAASSLSTRKASLRWNADTLSIVISSPQQSGAAGKSAGDNVDANQAVSEKMPSQLRACSDTSMRVTMSSQNRIAKLDALQSTSIRSQEQDSRINVMNEGKEVPENFRVDKLEEVEVGSCKDTRHGSTSRQEGMPTISEKQLYCTTTVHNERSWETNAWRARLVKAVSQKDFILPKNTENSLSPSSLGILCAGKVPGNDSNEASNSPNFHSHENRQGQVLQESHKDEHVAAREESASGVNAINLEKGKEKVMYNNSDCVSNTKESDDSNESIESCPSTIVPKRKYAECSAPKMYSGNKRCKREDNESSCSELLQKCGSSFFNWMSSLTHGLIVSDETTTTVPLDQTFAAPTGEESIAPPLPIQNRSAVPVQYVGFNSLFQSLYSHNVMITSRAICHQPERDYTEHVPNRLTLDLKGSNPMLGKRFGMGRETLDVDSETLAADNLQMVYGAGKGNFHNQFGIFPLRAERNLNLPNSSKSCSRSVEEKQNEFPVGCSNAATGDRGGFAESLWVSRFMPKTSMKLIEATPCDVESDFCAVNPKGVDDKLYCSSHQNVNVDKELNETKNFTSKGSSNGTEMPQEEPKQSETMASVFAKRLDALKHAKTSAVRLAITRDRGIHKRSNHRTSSFVVSYRSHSELEAGQETRKSSSGNGRMVLWTGDEGKEKLCSGSNEESRENFISEREHQYPGGTTAGMSVASHNLEANTSAEGNDKRRVEIKEGTSDFMESLPDNKQIVPYGIMSSDLCDESSVVLGALHRLRLPRSDIIRWLRSPIMHTTLDGFFVRLRFGKWEEALGGTGYHVARLNGALDRSRLSVTIRNSTCQVDSRFVSNHDFHEDELKAWWSAAMNGDWKLPSKEELNVKLRERGLLRS